MIDKGFFLANATPPFLRVKPRKGKKFDMFRCIELLNKKIQKLDKNLFVLCMFDTK